jgi:transposase
MGLTRCSKRIYRRRNKIKNFFCRIKDWRRTATCCDKLARNFHAAALVGALY